MTIRANKHRSFRGVLSRRAVLTPLLGAAVARALPGRAYAQSDEAPPMFQTWKSQFILLQPSRNLPAVSLIGLDGRAARLAATPGKVLLINIWATWCEVCQRDLPMLEHFHKAAGDQVDVAAVSTDTVGRETIRKYLERLSIRHLPIYLDPDGHLASSSAGSRAPLPIYGMPTTYLVTPRGRIAGYVSGVADWLSEDGQRLLAYYASR